MTNPNTQHTETTNTGVLRRNLARHRMALAIVFGLGAMVNLLALAAPLFALQVYDRVLASRSEETLLVLIGLLAIALLGMGAIDHFRRRVLAHIGLALADALSPHIRYAELTGGPKNSHLHHKLSHVQNAMASPALVSLLDLPWAPIFLAGLFLFHPALGWWAVILALASVIYIGWVWARIQHPTNPSNAPIGSPAPSLASIRKFASDAGDLRRRDQDMADRAAVMSATMTTARGFAQSLTIALAALLVLRGALTPGAILASTVLLARFLAPFDHLGSGIATLRLGWAAIPFMRMLPALPELSTKPAKGPIAVKGLAALRANNGTAYLNGITFSLVPGQTLGVIGLTGAGKSALLAHLSGQVAHRHGTILPHPTPETTLFVPAAVELHGQAMGDVISGGHPNPDNNRLWQAVHAMGLYEIVHQFAEGLQHKIGSHDLSAGQSRALVLARLAYQRPNIALLDDPFSGLDAPFRQRLQPLLDSLKRDGTITIIAAQQPSAMAHADQLLVLDHGTQKAFGPAADVLAATTKNLASLGPVTLKRQGA